MPYGLRRGARERAGGPRGKDCIFVLDVRIEPVNLCVFSTGEDMKNARRTAAALVMWVGLNSGCLSSNGAGTFARELQKQVLGDIRECPEGKDPTGECIAKHPGWINGSSISPLPIAPSTSDQETANNAAASFLFSAVTTDGSPVVRKVCRKADGGLLPLPAFAPSIYSSLTVFDRTRNQVEREVFEQVKGKIAPANLSAFSSSFSQSLSAQFLKQNLAGSSSNVLLVSAELLGSARQLSVETQTCLEEGATLITGVSGFVVLKSTSNSQLDIKSQIQTALQAAADATLGPESAKVASISADIGGKVAETVVQNAGFSVVVSQQKFTPVWMSTRAVVCSQSKARGREPALQLTPNQIGEGYVSVRGVCSSGLAAGVIADGFKCSGAPGDVELEFTFCKLEPTRSKKT